MIAAARRLVSRPSRVPRSIRATIALVLAAGAIVGAAAPPTDARAPSASTVNAPPTGAQPTKTPDGPGAGNPVQRIPSSPAMVAAGANLYAQDCASCHGAMLQGERGIAPSLIGVGAGPPLFYLTTGRMPLETPQEEPTRESPLFTRRQIDELVDYIVTFGGPAAPLADPSKGNIGEGFRQFTTNCAGCHQIVARGGITVDAVVPDLQAATADQIAEAVRMGPYLMPHFDAQQISQHQLDSIARYVLYTRRPENFGGWGIYNIGPIPEGIVAWFMGIVALVIVARLIGERLA